jgi:hypothetical protein
MTVREGGVTTFQQKAVDRPIIFRSYNHHRRIPPTDPRHEHELNPRNLEHSTLKIHEACSCTSAGPTYFRSVKLKGRKYIDGGVAYNNPAVIAWNEATLMANTPGEPYQPARFPKALVSLGTGKAKEHSRMGTLSLVKWSFGHITDTHGPHVDALALVGQHPTSSYFRFNVPEGATNGQHRGLSQVKMDHCKKKKKKQRDSIANGPPVISSPTSGNAGGVANGDAASPSLPNVQSLNPSRANTTNTTSFVQRAGERDAPLRAEARETRKGGYKPHKYHYLTFDKIRDRTAAYISSLDENGRRVSESMNDCAVLLRQRSLMRRDMAGGRQRWDQFRSHPDPRYQP